MKYLSLVLMWPKAILWLKIEMEKSRLNDLANVLGCKLGILPTSCLSLSCGASFRSIQV